jgi:hypothetical protein
MQMTNITFCVTSDYTSKDRPELGETNGKKIVNIRLRSGQEERIHAIVE